MKRVMLISSILFLAIIMVLPFSLYAQEKDDDVVIGKIIRLQSDVLGEERQIMVSLPLSYDQTAAKYPVMYLLDGRTHFLHATSTVRFLAGNGRIPEMIVVAVVNVNRNRDFTPTHNEDLPASGSAEKFIQFMQNELFPYIETNYRTQPYRLLEGHSLGGMFSIHVLFEHPEMFRAHFAMSPYIMWDNNYVLNQTVDKLQEPMEFNNFLYITRGDEPPYAEPLSTLTGMLESQKPSGLEWHYTVMENDNHGTVPLKSLYNGLETLYKDTVLDPAVADQGIEAVKAHYNKVSEKFGYQVDIPELLVNNLGYRAMRTKKMDQALEFFNYNVKQHPESANVYDSLGEGLEAAGELDLAKKNYETAVKIGSERKDNNLPVYKEHLEKVTKKLPDKES